MKDIYGKEIPNPGSDEAINLGCECPVLDNARGKGLPWPGYKGPVFWINVDCPIHGTIELFKDSE